MGLGTINDYVTDCLGTCAEIDCAGAECETSGGDKIVVPTVVTIALNVANAIDDTEFEESDTDNGTSTYYTYHKEDNGSGLMCWVADEHVFNQADVLSRKNYSLINGLNSFMEGGLPLELTDVEPGATCCTFTWQTPVGTTTFPTIYGEDMTFGEFLLVGAPALYFGDRWFYVSGHPLSTHSKPAFHLCGLEAGCGSDVYRPAAVEGYFGYLVHAALRVQICKSSCDGSWYGWIDIRCHVYSDIRDMEDYELGPTFAPDGVIAAETDTLCDPVTGCTQPGADAHMYWHVPNTGLKTNADGAISRNEAGDDEGSYISFTLTMEGDDPCPPDEVTKVPTRANNYAGHTGNFSVLKVFALNDASTGIATPAISAFPPTGTPSYHYIEVKLPITAGVTTVDDVLDVLDADARFAVSDRVGGSLTYPFGSGGAATWGLLGTGETTGGDSGTPVPAASVFADVQSQFSSPTPVPGYDFPGGSGTGELFTPINAGNYLDESACDSGEDEGCPFFGILDCVPTAATMFVYDLTSHIYAYKDFTWRFL